MSHEELQDKIRAQLKPQLPKRFYQRAASVGRREGGYGVELDGCPVRTPGKSLLKLQCRPLADAVAAEWEAQEKVINPAIMPLTKLANTAIDRIEPDNSNALNEILPYAGSDLLCYRASNPRSLQQQQAEIWDPYLQAVEGKLGAKFIITNTISHVDQPDSAISAIAGWLENLSAFQLAAVHTLTTLSGSVILAFAAVEGFARAGEIFHAAHVDEHWQIAQWGEDAEAKQRLDLRLSEIKAACRFLDLLDT